MIRAGLAAGALALGLLATACGASEPECTVPDGEDPHWIKVIGCSADYELLWQERSDSVFSRTRTINWLIDREQGNRVFFIDSVVWELHYFFAAAYLEVPGLTPVGTHAEFNILNYRRPNRRFVMGKLIHYIDQELVTIEFSAGDTADADMIAFAYDRIERAIYNGDELRYRPVSAAQESMLPDLASRIPIVRTEEVYGAQTFQSLHPRTGYGRLQFRRVAELAANPVAPTDIVVLDRVPNDISLVSGIVTDEFQTPLSHINILSKNRGTPNMALRGAFEDPALRALDGELVVLDVTLQDYSVAVADPADAEAFWESLRPQNPLVPQFDESVTGIVDLTDASFSDADIIGSKAANMAELGRLGDEVAGVLLPLPDAPLAVPFSHYAAHVGSSGAQPLIDALLVDAAQLDPDQLGERLFEIRWTLYRAALDPALLALVNQEIATRFGADTRTRFRSSTNVEDLPEFSGAGLYTSAGATLSEGDAAIENAIKVVFASAWNYQAFVEREFYRVDHDAVRMAVLIHPAFDNEDANGVAVTINGFNESRPAFYINSQVGEVSVTNPTGQATPEQILYYTWYEEPEYEIITRSSIARQLDNWPAGLAVLTDTELDQLATYLDSIHRHFRITLPGVGESFAMDVEFKLAGGRQLVIKQARPLLER